MFGVGSSPTGLPMAVWGPAKPVNNRETQSAVVVENPGLWVTIPDGVKTHVLITSNLSLGGLTPALTDLYPH